MPRRHCVLQIGQWQLRSLPSKPQQQQRTRIPACPAEDAVRPSTKARGRQLPGKPAPALPPQQARRWETPRQDPAHGVRQTGRYFPECTCRAAKWHRSRSHDRFPPKPSGSAGDSPSRWQAGRLMRRKRWKGAPAGSRARPAVHAGAIRPEIRRAERQRRRSRQVRAALRPASARRMVFARVRVLLRRPFAMDHCPGERRCHGLDLEMAGQQFDNSRF